MFKSTSQLFARGLRRGVGDAPPTFTDILKKHTGAADDTKLAKDEVAVILRKKKVKDRMVVEKLDLAEKEPTMTLQEIRNLGTEVKEQAPIEPVAQGTKKIDISRDYMAYSSKLEMYLRGIEPVPENVKYFKYDLPIPNIDPEFRGIEEIAKILSPVPNTPNENLWLQLKDVSGDSNWDDFEVAMRSKFNFEMDMYGEVENVAAYQDMMVNDLYGRLTLSRKN